MFAEVYLYSGSKEGVIIPKTALVQGDEDSFVWVLTEGKATRRQVTVGSSDEQNIVISSGLQEGEEVAATNVQALTEGVFVRIVR